MIVSVNCVSKAFADGTEALQEISLEVDEGEFVAVIGPSGCGKSTLLRGIAGLSSPTEGDYQLAPDARKTFVFQQPTLLPWRTVERNAELLLRMKGVDRKESRERAHEALRLVGLEGFEKSYPRALSGGMKMRLSLARSLAVNPDLFLLDEPFSALDEITRKVLNDELMQIWQKTNFTAILVTHNLQEAIFLASRVVVMTPRPGRIQKIINVPLPYPRGPELRRSLEYNTLVGELTGELEEAMA